jgi:hypothetical protein
VTLKRQQIELKRISENDERIPNVSLSAIQVVNYVQVRAFLSFVYSWGMRLAYEAAVFDNRCWRTSL